MRIAVLSDIHGNILALDAVLADLARRDAQLVVNLGDCASGPLWPRETMERLAGLALPTVRGNCDRAVGLLNPQSLGASDRFAYDRLVNDERRFLGALPQTIAVAPGILAAHGTPHDDEAALLDTIADGRVIRDRLADIAARLGTVDDRVVLCGHSHRPDVVRLPDGPLIVNPGSVGCPAYDMAGYVSESGSPHARYAIIETRPGGEILVEMLATPYDNEAAAARAEASGRSDWAYALRFGSMPISRLLRP
jgi:predicted phosphodiesterase